MKPFIKEVQSLRKRQYRQKTGLVIVEGYPEVSRANKAGVAFEKIYICPQIFAREQGEFDESLIVEVSKDEFAQIAFGERLKGVLAVCRPEKLKLSDIELKENPFIVVLEGVEKPGNLGTVIRTCDGAGVDLVINCDGHTDVHNHNVVRSSVGTLFTVKTVAATKEETYDYLQKHNMAIYPASAKAEKFYTDIDLRKASAIIIGNEHNGVSAFWNDKARQMIKIPMRGEATSLNAAMSASIIIYEAVRQRGVS